jgi:predicted nucleotidyltransferase component of viral defense system
LDKNTANNWKNNVLDIIFEALAESEVLLDCIVFKGARILNKRLESYSRQSLDIDANILKEFLDKYENYAQLQEILEIEISESIVNYLEKQETVIYELDKLRVIKKPNKDHKLGWNAFEVSISIKDLSQRSVRGLPKLKIDIAAPEELGENSISALNIGASTVTAYTLERISGEKLRAFLSSLPTYRSKVKKPGKAIRAKDIYDIARILERYPISNGPFWDIASKEFVCACRSRFLDCIGVQTFEEELKITEDTYNSDLTIPNDIKFEEAWQSLLSIVNYFTEEKVFPFYFPLPENLE